ncbi:MAG: Fic family protein, partial [Chloroflexi bacterium]|nr:Fic family protein [Chloroflexota bacterium]
NLIYILEKASRAVATLAGVGETIPNPRLLISPFMRREAVLSSRIEGTQASISDLFIYEASGEKRRDVVEVANYINTLEYGLKRLDDLPICIRLINELHERLLKEVRGEKGKPGTLRSEQVWIGSEGSEIEEARFIPPPPNLVQDLLYDLEKFINTQENMPPLVQCALMHYQIEAIHPYLDGNGRIGRLLIILFLCAKEVLPTPLLYLSAYFENDRSSYYDALLNVSVTGNWEAWLTYFLKGVFDQAQDALRRVRQLRGLQDEYRRKLQESRESANTLLLVESLFASPVITIPRAAQILGVTSAGARLIIQRLLEIGIIDEVEDRRPRLFIATELLEVIQMPRAPEKGAVSPD